MKNKDIIKKLKKEKEMINVCLKCGKPIVRKEKFCMSCGIVINIRKHYPYNLL